MSISKGLRAQREPEQDAAAIEAARRSLAWPAGLLALGFLLRLANAYYRSLNADEALHYLLSVQPSLAATYRASLTTAHPPLLIVLLHYWGMVGHSELFLRLPSLFAGVFFCWVMFCWLKRVTDDSTALMGLVLLLFSPALILLSGEVRQYDLLLLFAASSLYFLDRAVEENSLALILWSCAALYLALLTHYSSLIFALTLGIYAIARFSATRVRAGVIVALAAAQLCALFMVAFMILHHVSRLKARGVPRVIADTYLYRSLFHPGEEHALVFVARSNLRLFHYFFYQGAIGLLGLLLFAYGLFLLIKTRGQSSGTRLPSPRQIAFLLCFPLVLNCGLALAQIYPYGGSRHDSYLAIFVMSGIALALAHWKPQRTWWKPVALAVILAACNLFPSPQGEYIRPQDENRRLMAKTVSSLRALPPGSIVFTDDQGGLLLSYYLCQSKVVQIEENPFQPFMRAPCGQLSIITIDPDMWIFRANTFPEVMKNVQQTYGLSPGTTLWLFQTGWFVDKEYALREELKAFGCTSPQNFGKNMFLCRVGVGG
jgi:hypothetical protein